MLDFLKTYGTLFVAIVALMQVWLIAAWKRYIQKGRIQVHPTAPLEIGFGSFGPSVALMGTLRAVTKDVFVEKMMVRITRIKDKAEHVFTWRLFRSNLISLVTSSPQAIQIAASFLVTPATPKQYNAFFASPLFMPEYGLRAQLLRDAWREYIQKKKAEGQVVDPTRVSTVLQDPNLSWTLFSGFKGDPLAFQLFQDLSNNFFWHAGDYDLELTVSCSTPTPDVVSKWRFSLSKKDEDTLRLNIIVLLQELCNLPVNYNFAYPEYKKG